ncbi:MAG: hypothetical protein ACI9XC_000762 [Gammaproteobacteria bacterium]|jgi:hypothetical protein
MSVGRNDACPCGSGKKYKQCCLNKTLGWSLQSKIMLSMGGVILAICIVLLISSIRNFEGGASNRVWSEEHQHWHYN